PAGASLPPMLMVWSWPGLCGCITGSDRRQHIKMGHTLSRISFFSGHASDDPFLLSVRAFRHFLVAFF
ncbi:uncharacterized protein C8A04DRAFT_9132, partial [Dichotomopilus funicola]